MTEKNLEVLRARAVALGLHGLITHWDEAVASGWVEVLPAVRTRASLARSSIVIHVGIPAGQIRSLPVIRFIPGLIRTPARPRMALDHRVAM